MDTARLNPNRKNIADINEKQGIPRGWKQVRFKECIEIANGQVDPKVEPYCNMKHIGLENIEKFTGRLLFTKLAKDENLTSGKYFFNKGDVLYGKIRPELSKVYLAEFEGICSADIYPIRPKKDIVGNYLKFLLLDHRFFRYAVSVSTRTGLPKINRDDLGGFKIHVPPIREQQKIASILSTWDKAIELKEKLIEQKKKRKKGLMQRLLTGKVRLPGFKEEWIKLKVKDLIREVNHRTTQNNQYEILSVTKNGIVPQREQFNKQIASGNNTGYKIVRRYNLVFSTMNLWMGSLDVLTTHDIGIVSPAYKVFKFIEQNITPLYSKYFMISDHMIRVYKMNSEQGASIVRRNLDIDGLLSTIVSIPPLEEQLEISKVLQISDKELALLNSQLEALKQQKKGLMQILLTGKVRVKC